MVNVPKFQTLFFVHIFSSCFLEKNIILCILKGISPFKMQKIIFFQKKKKKKKN